MKIELPEKVKYILSTLSAHGHEAYAVGGCVRDTLLNRKPEDWDITTSALPDEVKRIFPRTIDTGIQHGTVTIMLKKEGFEVTTYRIDGEYEDSRHPKEVTFTRSLKDDLLRRDFTINAMAYNEQSGLVDLFGGIEDLQAHMIRCVGDPLERFTEDALRMMRALRFSAQLDYRIEARTQDGIRRLARTLGNISAERIRTEFEKLLVSDHPDYLLQAYELGLTAVFFPEFDAAMKMPQNHPHHIYCVGEHILHAMMAVAPDRILRLATLFHDIGKPSVHTVEEDGYDHFRGHSAVSDKMSVGIMRRLRYDNDTIRKVSALVRFHDYKIGLTPKAVRRAVSRIGTDLFPLLLEVKRADAMGQSEYRREEKLSCLAETERLYQEVLAQKACLNLKDLALTGRDLIASGMKPGKEIGETLGSLLELVLEDPACNTREYLLAQVQKRIEG